MRWAAHFVRCSFCAAGSLVACEQGAGERTLMSGEGTATTIGTDGARPEGSGGSGTGSEPFGTGADGGAAATPSVLLFSKTQEYRHQSIEAGVQALTTLAGERGWNLEATEDAGRFSEEGLRGFNVLVFLNTTGDVLNDAQQGAMERFVRAGNGFVGVHAASDTEYDWAWYGALVGAYFRAHPAIQHARLEVESDAHPATVPLPAVWERTDEWYGFAENPRGSVEVLLTLDEQSYSPGEGSMGEDHPVAWFHDHDSGRAFYTALGHTAESYQESLFLEHLAGAIVWAAGGS